MHHRTPPPKETLWPAPDPLPASDSIYLTDGGLETTLVFLDGIDLPDFAAFPLLDSEDGKSALRPLLQRPTSTSPSARGSGFVLDTPTWRANLDWGARLGYDADTLAEVNRRAVDFAAGLAGARPA